MGIFLQFLSQNQDVSVAYLSSYNAPLVVLSVLTAIFASYVAFQLSECIADAKSTIDKAVWLSSGSFALGGGVWAMHFIGMLAFSLPCGISYDPHITLFSMLPGVLASGVALWIISRAHNSALTLFTGSLLIGSGIGAMHYSGMAAMRLDAVIYYSPNLFALSIVFAVILAFMSIYAKFGLRRRLPTLPDWVLMSLSAVLMGGSISGMHYIAMEAAYFIPVGDTVEDTTGVSPTMLAIGIATVTILLMGLTLAAVFLAKYVKMVEALNFEIEERKTVEGEIRKLSRAVEQSPATVVITDKDGLIEYVNPKFTQITGYSEKEALGNNPKILKSGEQTEEQYAELWDTITSGKEWRGEFHNKRKDGSLFWEAASISPIRSRDGEITNFIAVKEDITERKHMEQALITARKRAELDVDEGKVLEHLLRLSITPISMEAYLGQVITILLKDVPWLTLLPRGGIFLTSDQGAGQELDLIASHALGDEITTRCRKVPFGHCLCGQAAVSQQIVHADCVDHRHDTRYDGMEDHGHYNVPFVHENTVLGMVTLYLPHGYQKSENDLRFLRRVGDVLSIGISRRYAAQSLVQATKTAEAANVAKSEFLSTMSHELRTPLTSIKGALGLIQGGHIHQLPNELQSMIDIASTNSDRLMLLINDILDIEKIEAGMLELHMQKIDVLKLVEDAIEANTGYGDECGVTFVKAEMAQKAFVNGDPYRLMQVLSNLMSNAAKFSPAGEQVSLSVTLENDRVRIDVKDNGLGIPEGYKDKIFDKFTQVDSSDTRQKKGTGLGLSITKSIVEQHGGIIDFETEEGVGSTFFITLPSVD